MFGWLSAEAARAYKHVLGLLISQRKPSWYLLAGRKHLNAQADIHLRLLADAGVITPAFRDLAIRETIVFAPRAKNGANNVPAAARNKAVSALRVEVGGLIGIPLLYDLDRLDLTVRSTLHAPAQLAVGNILRRMSDPEFVRASGMFGDHLLSPGNDLSKVLYSFTLHEISDKGALLRVQADSLDQPFDLNQGAKLDMGSSAKLRTLITYLHLIAELHAQYRVYNARELDALEIPEKDVLTHWAVAWLRQSTDKSLHAMLLAAMGRTYSADPGEAFFTGGGLHTFVNFNKADNGRVVDLWEATRNSINLPFIRLMRDLVRHFIYRAPSTAARILQDVEDPRRRTYLMKFADKEGRTFLARFWKKYRGLTPQQTTDVLLNHLTAHPTRLAAVYRYIEPEAGPEAFKGFMKARLTNPANYSDQELQNLYDAYGPERFNLADRAYITQVHPLELWLVAYLRKHHDARWPAMIEASAEERVAVYDWLYKTGRKNAQDSRIQSLLEIEAFQEIHQRWRRLGYPFASLVPSYATAIGSSADRPAALAELVGVILNDGVKLAPATIQRLDFAADTPYHTTFVRKPGVPERIFPADIAKVVRQALVNVVQEGTARRVAGAFVTQRGKLAIGGKTGTGDHRYETYSPGGAVLESRVVNRVATFAFFIGRRFYGVITVFVPGEQAAHYKFTSALPVQLLKAMAPALQPLVAHAEGQPLDWADEVAAFEAAHAPPAPSPAATVEVTLTTPANINLKLAPVLDQRKPAAAPASPPASAAHPEEADTAETVKPAAKPVPKPRPEPRPAPKPVPEPAPTPAPEHKPGPVTQPGNGFNFI